MNAPLLKQGSYVRANSGADMASVYPRFFEDTIVDQAASAREGREIYKTVERVEIIMPGISQLTKPVANVTQEHIDRWPDQYKQFKAGQEMSVSGVPLEQWPILKRAQVLELKHLGFLTVEQVANMNDHAIQRIGMGGLRLKQLAQSYLDDEVAQAELAKTTAENARLKQQVSEQGEQIKQMSAMLERVSDDLLALQNRPHPIATYVPGQHDPIAAAQQAQPMPAPASSSLADLPAPSVRKRRGVPRDEDGSLIRNADG